MDNRDIELFSVMAKERQDEILRELKTQHVLRGQFASTGTARKLLFTLLGLLGVAMAVSLWVIA